MRSLERVVSIKSSIVSKLKISSKFIEGLKVREVPKLQCITSTRKSYFPCLELFWKYRLQTKRERTKMEQPENKLSHADKRRKVLTSLLKPSRPIRVCDVGANPLSEPPYLGLVQDGVAEVVGFEPNPEAFSRLQKTRTCYETYFKQAIGLQGNRTLYLHPLSGFSSLFPMDKSALAQIGKEKWLREEKVRHLPVKTSSLDDIIGLEKIDVLKMDLQGAELEVIQGGRKTLSDCIAIVTEVRFHRIYEREPLFGDIDVALREQGFKLHKFLFTKSVMMPHNHESKVRRQRLTSQLLDGDAVYIREGMLKQVLSTDQVIFLALAADAIFDSPDLALLCLDILVERRAVDDNLPKQYIRRLRTKQRNL